MILKSTKQINNLFDNIDIVINAAAVTSGVKDIINRPHIHVNDNALMNINILKQIFKNKNIKHYIFFSCTVMYQSSIKNKMKKNLIIK